MNQDMTNRPQPVIIQIDMRAELCKVLHQELGHLDAMIRFATKRRNTLERQLRDLEKEERVA